MEVRPDPVFRAVNCRGGFVFFDFDLDVVDFDLDEPPSSSLAADFDFDLGPGFDLLFLTLG